MKKLEKNLSEFSDAYSEKPSFQDGKVDGKSSHSGPLRWFRWSASLE